MHIFKIMHNGAVFIFGLLLHKKKDCLNSDSQKEDVSVNSRPVFSVCHLFIFL